MIEPIRRSLITIMILAALASPASANVVRLVQTSPGVLDETPVPGQIITFDVEVDLSGEDNAYFLFSASIVYNPSTLLYRPDLSWSDAYPLAIRFSGCNCWYSLEPLTSVPYVWSPAPLPLAQLNLDYMQEYYGPPGSIGKVPPQSGLLFSTIAFEAIGSGPWSLGIGLDRDGNVAGGGDGHASCPYATDCSDQFTSEIVYSPEPRSLTLACAGSAWLIALFRMRQRRQHSRSADARHPRRRSDAFTSIVLAGFAGSWIVAHPTSADPYADHVLVGPAGSEAALGACDGLAVDVTGETLVVAFYDDYLVNPDDGPEPDGRLVSLEAPGCSPAQVTASQTLPMADTEAALPVTGDWNLVHDPLSGDFAPGVPYHFVRIVGPAICEDAMGSPLPTSIDCIETLNPVTVADEDGDGVADAVDNCTEVPNGPSAGACVQTDADWDGYGNVCDIDPNNDGAAGQDDFYRYVSDEFGPQLIGSGTVGGPFDVNCDGGVGLDDAYQIRISISALPGPSGLSCQYILFTEEACYP